MNAASHALDAYKTPKSLSILEKSEMGIYGLISANGLSEAVTGKDMFGNELTEEQRQNSLMTALGIAGVAGVAKVVDKVGTSENVGKAGESTAKAIAREIGKVEVPTGIKVEQLSASNCCFLKKSCPV